MGEAPDSFPYGIISASSSVSVQSNAKPAMEMAGHGFAGIARVADRFRVAIAKALVKDLAENVEAGARSPG